MMVPKATPKEIVEKINKDVVASLKSKEVDAKLEGAVRHSGHRHAGGVRQDHRVRNRQSDAGVQGSRHLTPNPTQSCGPGSDPRAVFYWAARGSAWPITRLIDGERRRSARSTSSTFSCTACTAERRIDPAMEIDDLALVGLAHPHVVDVADHAALGGDFGERRAPPP